MITDLIELPPVERMERLVGYSSRPEIMRRVTHLVEYVKALETAGDAVASAVWKVQDWSDTRVGMTVDEWEKVRVGKEAKP